MKASFKYAGALLLVLTLTGCSGSPTAATQQTPVGLPMATAPSASDESSYPQPSATTTCIPPAESTPPMAEGPYFTAGSPQRASLLEPATVGEQLVLAGSVLSTDCLPVPNALLDFWQANGDGVYDNIGFGLRGQQFTDAAGRYELTTVLPGFYSGRTAHIHVKVQAPGGPALTTQLYLPDVEANTADRLFDQRLVISLQRTAAGYSGTFDFVLQTP